ISAFYAAEWRGIDPQRLKEILDWTGGQPFLTQKLCWIITTSGEGVAAGEEAQKVEELVRSRLIQNWEAQDEPEHLRTIRDRLLRNSRRSQSLLKLYQQILRRGKIPAHNLPQYLELRLSGLIVKQEGNFIAFNRIYQMVFDQRWINQALQELQPKPTTPPRWNVVAVGLAVSMGLVGLRSLGFLQQWELKAFDQLMVLRPDEGPDKRLFLVTITERDVQSQPDAERGVMSLSDQSLNRLLTKLEQAQPRAIGLDIYRDYSVKSELTQLTKQMQRSDRLVAICHYGDPGVPPLPK
ncbi:MAG: CHASE2 domain-containing protein, partial [Oscillatoriales cyanobacterium C42_A2020_001]|nr:CHASE2 domain-containing protein [Leptolyngbyaceae cyanobacterium C42_A2020_001]